MESVFLDAGYLLALELARDQNHLAASAHWQRLVQSLPPLVTTSYVFDEVVTFLNSRGLHAKAVEMGNNLLSTPSVRLVHINEPLFLQGWAYFQQHQDKSYSLTDCISFVVMNQLQIRKAFTFDQHFNQAGFQVEP